MAIPTMRAYREQFMPSRHYPEPHAILTVSVTIGENAEEVADLSRVNELFLLRLRTGQLGRYPTVEEAKTYQFTEQERALIASMPLNFIAGTADQVYRQVMDLAELCQADEVMITTTLPGAEDRRRTLTTMAERFGLVASLA
jgi:alkanesulfonate monooxygenase SsuD/methylene tetrahydromethanopterin reductase-like flavin-dependent oxidoreductase (luciferase family)